MEEAFATRSHPLTCPFCEAHDLRAFGHNSARCDSCGGLLSGALLGTMRGIIRLPDACGPCVEYTVPLKTAVGASGPGCRSSGISAPPAWSPARVSRCGAG